MHRTTSVFNQSHRKSFSEEKIESGWNPIYNILASYAEFDLAVGDEVIAFTILVKVMFEL